MKRYLMLFIVLVPGLCFASLSFDASVGYKGNAQMKGNLDLGLSLALDDNTYTLLTREESTCLCSTKGMEISPPGSHIYMELWQISMEKMLYPCWWMAYAPFPMEADTLI